MATLAVIPARGGSKGVPRKNIIDLGGQPLIGWSITAAQASGLDRIVVSTDDEEIADVSAKLGAEVLKRPAALAEDASPTRPVLQHALTSLAHDFDSVVLLQPTSPFRTADDIRGCLARHERTGRSVVSVTKAKAGPWWTFTLDEDGALAPVLEGATPSRRQGLDYYVLNGAVYVWSRDLVVSQRPLMGGALAHVMPAERSLDIDEPFDLHLARLLAAQPWPSSEP